MANYEKQAEQLATKGLREAKKSGEDWVEYIQEHPVQSVAFGLVLFYAIKGYFKKD